MARGRRPGRWRDFAAAREFVHGLHLLDTFDWIAYCRGQLLRTKGRKPADVPASPSDVYRNRGWRGMRDWLGPGAGAPAEPGYRSFASARRFAGTLGLESAREWRDWCRQGRAGRPPRPRDVPEDPPRIYPLAWRGWHDWLGHRVADRPGARWRPFPAAREFARALDLGGVAEWRSWCRGERPDRPARPPDIPAAPHLVYCGHGFSGYADWLGTRRRRRGRWADFATARAGARELSLRSSAEWFAWIRGDRPDLPPPPPDFPPSPRSAYRLAGWRGWADFLGTAARRPARRRFLPFAAAREHARTLGLRSAREWQAYVRGHPDLEFPVAPARAYRQAGWAGWGDFLGTGNVRPRDRQFLAFLAARDFARALGLRTRREWAEFSKGLRADLGARPREVPAAPHEVYRGCGWAGWADFLGVEPEPDRRRKRCRPLEAASELARSLGLATERDWSEWACGRRPDLPPFPADLPSSPPSHWAKSGWPGWPDFLGRPRERRRSFATFEEARAFARTLGLRSGADWVRWAGGNRPDLPPRPPRIPFHPEKVYAGAGWRGWADYLRPAAPPDPAQ